jgi:DNA-binding transcriptional ArsR family regulator
MSCAMTGKKTISVSSDPQFLEELSEYLEVLSHPARLKILKFIEPGPKEITAIAEHTGMSYQNTKKHLDRLVAMSLVKRDAGLGRETDRGIAPVWKYSLADGGLSGLTKTLGIFSSIPVPPGYNDIRKRIGEVRESVLATAGIRSPVLILMGGSADGRVFPLTGDRVPVGRDDPGKPLPETAATVSLPEHYLAVTRVNKPHAIISRSGKDWLIEDNGSTGGTYLNSERLAPGKKTLLSHGDLIDLSVGTNAARFLFVSYD